jgi:hypothetical protein
MIPIKPIYHSNDKNIKYGFESKINQDKINQKTIELVDWKN